MALAYFSFGPDAEDHARRSLGDYYAWLGEALAGMIVDGAAKDADAVRARASAFDKTGCDELFFLPSSSDPDQVGLLAEAAGL
ncbi:MAG TPA: hypothetical protein VK920_11555 [Solirubrobacterales bacterium]|nr:hypothetical protein [Solirubrobacterales bacterium]